MELSSSNFLLFISASLLLLCSANAVIKLPANKTVPAVIVFGDSIVDPGNNDNLETILKCNFPPYGRDFKGGIPTGRFCNGKVPSDLLAEELGVKELVPAYLDPTLQPNDLLTGVSFASGGTGYDPLTSKTASVLSLNDQLEMFKEYIEKLKVLVGEDGTNFILANSLFMVVAGSDDFANTYFTLRARKEYDVPSYANFMVTSASTFLKELYNLGARRMAVFSAPPLGCLPMLRTLGGGVHRECVKKYNDASIVYNNKLSSGINSLNKGLPQAKIVYVDIYGSLLDLIQRPKNYGFEVANKGCCGTGTLEVVVLCNPLSLFTCPNAATHVFWDSYHPTERAYKVIVSLLLDKYINDFF